MKFRNLVILLAIAISLTACESLDNAGVTDTVTPWGQRSAGAQCDLLLGRFEAVALVADPEALKRSSLQGGKKTWYYRKIRAVSVFPFPFTESMSVAEKGSEVTHFEVDRIRDGIAINYYRELDVVEVVKVTLDPGSFNCKNGTVSFTIAREPFGGDGVSFSNWVDRFTLSLDSNENLVLSLVTSFESSRLFIFRSRHAESNHFMFPRVKRGD